MSVFSERVEKTLWSLNPRMPLLEYLKAVTINGYDLRLVESLLEMTLTTFFYKPKGINVILILTIQ